jgi:hypothetical protein
LFREKSTTIIAKTIFIQKQIKLAGDLIGGLVAIFYSIVAKLLSLKTVVRGLVATSNDGSTLAPSMAQHQHALVANPAVAGSSMPFLWDESIVTLH